MLTNFTVVDRPLTFTLYVIYMRKFVGEIDLHQGSISATNGGQIATRKKKMKLFRRNRNLVKFDYKIRPGFNPTNVKFHNFFVFGTEIFICYRGNNIGKTTEKKFRSQLHLNTKNKSVFKSIPLI